MEKPYYIIIRGPLGIGKTTIAKKLAKSLNARIFHIDKVLEELKLDKVDEKLGCIPLENFLKANKKILPKIKNILNKREIVILDGCFYHKEQIKHIESELASFKEIVFTLKAPLETCINRDSKRKKIYGPDAAKVVYKLVSKFDYGTKVSTGNKSLKETVREISNRFKE